VPEGTTPSVEDAVARLDHLRAHGPTPVAFTFSHRFTPDGTPAPGRFGHLSVSRTVN
jgi:hypothetical protein